MPNRIIKESICTSEQIDHLSDQAECFFYRLMVNCDDFGRLDARPAILKSKCYPLKSIDINKLCVMLTELKQAGLVMAYEVDERPYLHLVSWEKHQQIRAKRSKYPAPELGHEITGNQLISSDSICPRNPIQSNLESNPISIAETPENLPAIAVAKAPAVQVKKIGFDYTEKKWLGLQDNASQIKIWAETYPGVDLRAEFLEMKSWLTSNPANRKTNLPKFINNWLKKSQDRASRPENKTFYERTKDQKQADAEKRYEGLLNADHETLVKWGLA